MEIKRGKYKTKQRELILSFLKNAGETHITAETIAEGLKGCVGQTTVYRYLDELQKEGIVIKYEAPGGAASCYRHMSVSDTETDFYHFICTSCGEMRHFYCERLKELSKHVSDEHGISLDSKKTVLYGFCRTCKKDTLALEEQCGK